MAGERGKRKRLHKLLRRSRHHHVYLGGLALQRAHQLRSLVSGNSSGDTYEDTHAPIVKQPSISRRGASFRRGAQGHASERARNMRA
jgi:hypothetical protein